MLRASLGAPGDPWGLPGGLCMIPGRAVGDAGASQGTPRGPLGVPRGSCGRPWRLPRTSPGDPRTFPGTSLGDQLGTWALSKTLKKRWFLLYFFVRGRLECYLGGPGALWRALGTCWEALGRPCGGLGGPRYPLAQSRGAMGKPSRTPWSPQGWRGMRPGRGDRRWRNGEPISIRARRWPYILDIDVLE